jgi:arylsulfatase A-like enzyme/Flp pilus assembly protein TadD
MSNVQCVSIEHSALSIDCRQRALLLTLIAALLACGCRGSGERPAAPRAQNVLLVTIDTLRADRVGAYGYARARTPTLDALAHTGVRFDKAYATAPITLVSHASLMTGRYPPGHRARHNGIRMDLAVPTIAEALAHTGLRTAAFVAAFPLDRRFGLIKGFQTYGDRMPRGADGRLANERPARMVVDDALAWYGRDKQQRFFLWVHFFEPHSPYGNPLDPVEARRPATDRYDDEVAEADRQLGRLLEGMDDSRASTMIVVAGDHGEAFGEHGEITHSLFTYDTTLRVPLIMSGAGVEGNGRAVTDAVSLVDVAPTIIRIAGQGSFDSDGVDLSPAFGGRSLPTRSLYAESFAPLFDFGWSPLRTLRSDGWKYIAAPHPELYNLTDDPGETQNRYSAEPQRAADMARRTDAISSATLPATTGPVDPETVSRLQALGYVSGARPASGARADPKDRREIAARLAQITSGELQGPALEQALRAVLREDANNPQANVRLGYLLMESGRCSEAEPLFSRAIAAQFPTADAHLGLAGCQIAAKDLAAAEKTLRQADLVEPDNAVVSANLGIVVSDSKRPGEAIKYLQRALSLDPDLHQARFSLAVAYARLGRRQEAAAEASELLRRLPPDAVQRPEVERLLAAVR